MRTKHTVYKPTNELQRRTSHPIVRMKKRKTKKVIERERKKKHNKQHKKAWELQKRFDEDREEGEQPEPKKIAKDRYVIDHICFSTELTVGIRWICGRMTEEPKLKILEDAKEAYEEYEKKGKITRQEYMTYLKFRDEFKYERRRRRGEEEQHDSDSSDVNTSDIE